MHDLIRLDSLERSAIYPSSIIAAAGLRTGFDNWHPADLLLNLGAHFLANLIGPANPALHHLAVRTKEDYLGNAVIVAVSKVGNDLIRYETDWIGNLRVADKPADIIDLVGFVCSQAKNSKLACLELIVDL